jgi:WD40-like Beta Propeller Repeat
LTETASSARRGVVAVKRLIALLSAAGLTLLGLVAASAPASATFSGPNGQITFGLFNPAIGDDQIWKSNPDGSYPVQLTTVPSEVSDWSPDGNWIAFDFFDGQTVQIATMDADGPLTTDETASHGEPAYSPDGSRIAFENEPVDAPDGIFLMDASNGQDVTRITSNPYGIFDETPSFSPDGTQIVFDRVKVDRGLGRQSALFVVRTDGSDLRRITEWGVKQSRPIGHPVALGLCSTARPGSTSRSISSIPTGQDSPDSPLRRTTTSRSLPPGRPRHEDHVLTCSFRERSWAAGPLGDERRRNRPDAGHEHTAGGRIR